MWPTSITRPRASTRGFTFLEAMVSLIILVIVMSVAMTLLFSMRAFAERQAVHLAPRQTARQATEFLTHVIDSAGDLNRALRSPNALVTHYFIGTAEKVAMYNNLPAGSPFGDEGTDIVTLSYVNNPAKIEIVDPTNTLKNGITAMALKYSAGCGVAKDDAANLAAFKTLTGAIGTAPNEKSPLLLAVSESGVWSYLEITAYVSSDCNAGNDHFINVTFKAVDDATRYNPPSGAPQTFPNKDLAYLVAGVEFTTFRVRNQTLEQKVSGVDNGTYYAGLFDPDSDAPGTHFTPLVENVEDFQVAYLFSSDPGTWWNASQVDTTTDPPTWTAKTLPAGQNGVPLQERIPVGKDAALVRAVRLTIVGRSTPLRQVDSQRMSGSSGTAGHGFMRPFAEDHAAGSADVAPNLYERYRMTTTMLLRNRSLGAS